MSLELFDNTANFRPSGRVLEYWKFLPQTQTDSSVPSLFGNLKSMFVPYLMVAILIICEVGLFYTLQEEGVSFMTLLALSIFDFVIAILPAVIFIYGNLIFAVIKTKMFITQTYLRVNNNIPLDFSGNLGAYHAHLEKDLATYKAHKRNHHILEFILVTGIIALTIWKFMSLYQVFGNDIFVLGIGRYVIVVLILSLITHIFFTKVVFAHRIFMSGLNSQKKLCIDNRGNRITTAEVNRMKLVTFDGIYNTANAGNQFIGEKLLDTNTQQYQGNPNIKTIEYANGTSEHFAIKRITNHKSVYIVYTGLLTDPELTALAGAQPDAASKQAILATGKQIQLDQ